MDVHKRMTALGSVQVKWSLQGVMLTLNLTHGFHKRMNFQETKFISYIYALILHCFGSYIFKYSQISVIRTLIIRNYWVIRRRWTVPNFFSIIYCNKTTNYSNFDYPKNSIFRSDSSVLVEEVAIKLPFKIRSPNVTHGDHDFFVWSSSIYTPE